MAATRHIPQIPALRMPRSTGPANLFHIYYTPVFAPWRIDREDLTPNNVHFAKLMDDYQNARQDTLRWQVIANTAVKEVPKAVMRERLRRRVREAFRQGMKEMGYDSEGRLLLPGSASWEPLEALKGTLEIHCRGRAGLDCQFGEIVTAARGAVQAIVKSCKQRNGKHGNFPPASEWWKLDVRRDRLPVRAQQWSRS